MFTLPGPYAPAPAGINFNSQSGVNTITSAGTGGRLAQFPQVGALPDIVLVTPFRPGAWFCNLTSLWSTPVPDVRAHVRCFDFRGASREVASLITYGTP